MATVGAHHVGTLAREQLGDRAADAVRRAGHENTFAA
jgi:hypothetical protein